MIHDMSFKQNPHLSECAGNPMTDASTRVNSYHGANVISSERRRAANLTATALQLAERNINLQSQRIENLPGSNSNIIGDTGRDWNYLLQNHRDDGEEIDLSDNDSIEIFHEDEEDCNEDDAMEEDPEDIERHQKHGREIGRERVATIIQESINQFTDAWIPGKYADYNYDQAFDPHLLWHELRAQPPYERNRVIEETRTNIEVCEYKLDKLCEAILETIWNSERAIRQQCSSLMTSVDNLEQEKWELSVYLLESPPPKIDYDDLSPTLGVPVAHQLPARRIPSQELHIANFKESSFQKIQGQSQQMLYQGTSSAPTSHIHRQTEIIDLGSGSESSEVPPSDLVFPGDTVRQPALERMIASDQVTSYDNKTNVSEFMIIDSIETNEYDKQTQPRIVSSKDTSPSAHLSRDPNDSPQDASYATVSTWSLDELIKRRDRKRVVMKILQEMTEEDRELIRARIHIVRKQNLLQEIPTCIEMFARGGNKIPGVLPRDLTRIVRFSKLFLCWWFADDYFNTHKEVTAPRLEELAECLQGSRKYAEGFYNFLLHVMDHIFSKEALKKPLASSQAEIIIISDDDEK